jgi:hypothetical protein
MNNERTIRTKIPTEPPCCEACLPLCLSRLGLLVQLASSSHSPKRFDALVHRHLSAIPMLQLQLLMLVATRADILVGPVESIRHVVIVLGHPWAVADSIRDDCAVWLDEIDLAWVVVS